jgi:hypothetical protein
LFSKVPNKDEEIILDVEGQTQQEEPVDNRPRATGDAERITF